MGIHDIKLTFFEDESDARGIEKMKEVWEHKRFSQPELQGLKLEFEAFYRDQKRLAELIKENPEIRGLFLHELKEQYGIGKEVFQVNRQRGNLELAFFIITINDLLPLTKASILTTVLLNKLEEEELIASFESVSNLNKPISDLDAVDIMQLNLSFIRSFGKYYVERYKSFLLKKQSYFERLGVQKLYKKEDYEYAKKLTAGHSSEEESLSLKLSSGITLSVFSTSNHSSEDEKSKPVSFEWLGTENQLYSLYDLLIKNNFIESSWEYFKVIFDNEFKMPIIWRKDKPHLLFLFDQLIQNKNPFVKKPNSLYKGLEKCFTDKKNKPLKNFKQCNQGYMIADKNRKPYTTIKDIINSLQLK